MNKNSNLKRIIAGSLALILTFTTVTMNSHYFADETTPVENTETVQETKNVSTDIQGAIPEASAEDEGETKQEEEQVSEVSNEETEVVEESTDKKVKIVTITNDLYKISVSKVIEIADAMPKTISVIPAQDAVDITGDDKAAEIAKIDIPVTWVTDNDNITNDSIMVEYTATVDEAIYDITDVVMPKLQVYIGNFDINEYAVCPSCFGPITVDNVCVECYKKGNLCTCEEHELDRDNSQILAAWDNKYLGENYEALLNIDEEWYATLSDVQKEHVDAIKILVTKQEGPYEYAQKSIKEIIEAVDNETISLDIFSGTNGEFTYEDLKKLESFDITLVDASEFLSAYMLQKNEIS